VLHAYTGVAEDKMTEKDEAVRSQHWRYVLSVLTEHLLLACALASIIPPPVSIKGQHYNFLMAPAVLMLTLLLPCRYLAIRRGEESWPGAALKGGIFIVAGIVNYERASM
jgi:hypothetical protein